MKKQLTLLLALILSLSLALPAFGQSRSSRHREDDAAVTADYGNMCLAVRTDTQASSAGTDGDYAWLNLDATGNLWVTSSVLEDVGETAANPLLGIGGVRRAVLVSSSGTTGDNSTFNLSANGALWTEEAAIAVAYGSSPTAVAAGVFGAPIADLEGLPYINTGHPFAIACYLETTATTSTQITGCELVSGKSIYIKSIMVSGDIANAQSTPWQIQEGTSTGCTGPTVLVGGWHQALGTDTMIFDPPIKGTVAEGLCVLDATAGSKTITITGYVAP